tara:strand:- start:4305 stop:4514 length:210 start_codon:yes stop_codon:yes gene_type:complete
VAKKGWESGVDKNNTTTAADIGLRRDEIHDARRLRDAERDDPGVVQRTINDMVDRDDGLPQPPLRPFLK